MTIRRTCGAFAAATAIVLATSAAGAHAKAKPPKDAVGQCFWIKNDCIGEARFEWDGDDMWVVDARNNGWGVGAKIQTDYGKVRWCTTFKGKNVWHECRFNHREYTCVRWRMYEMKGQRVRYASPRWSPWYHTAYGNEVSPEYCR
ncbi:MAG TPA: hypothetical protein VFZ00_25100 [Solirubrobacter sp.]|nr:hypothetical protein [Solirubrobacter sp.]